MNAQYHFEQFQRTRSEYRRMKYAYRRMIARTNELKAGKPLHYQIAYEANLQAEEQRIARFEWRHGIH